jgi:hypothetical protein
MSLSGKTLANTYKDILQIDNSNNGVQAAAKTIKDGQGTSSSLSIGQRATNVQPTVNTTSTFKVEDVSGTDLLVVDSTNSKVSALGNYVNTQYAYFSVGNTQSASFADDTHQAIPFASAMYGNVSYPPAFGTGTDPATTFTTSEGNGTRASDIVSCLWYATDAISIDAVTGIEGADTATGDTTRMHLFSYDFTSGATACLTNGTLLAHNSDVTNAGSEQPYLSSFTVDSASVAAGKVILAFFKSDSINSDYTLNIKVKYHLT